MTVLERMVKVAAAGVRKLFEQGGEIEPHWVVEKQDGDMAIIVTNWSNDSEKDFAEKMIRDFLEANRCVRFVFMAEGWMVNLPPETDTAGMRAATHPDRVEVVTIQAEERDGAHIAGHMRILRDGNKLSLCGLETYHTFSTGRFANMFKHKES